MSIRSSIKGISCCFALAGMFGSALAGDQPSVARTSADETAHSGQHKQHTAALARIVRETTRRFRDVEVAKAEGYELMFGCVSGPDDGAMGLHYVNMDLVSDPALDARRPEIVIYEPTAKGGRRLIGADYLVLADAWHATNANAPELMGQLMHLIPSPNRYGLPSFYTLHVWAWKPNRNGAFVNWHPDVSCEGYDGGK